MDDDDDFPAHNECLEEYKEYKRYNISNKNNARKTLCTHITIFKCFTMDVEVVVVVTVDDGAASIIVVGVGRVTENGIGCIGWVGWIGGIGVCIEGTDTGCVTTDCATGEVLGSDGEGENDSMDEIEDNVGRKVVRKI